MAASSTFWMPTYFRAEPQRTGKHCRAIVPLRRAALSSSTVTEAGLADMTQLTDFIRSKGVPAVFVESSVSHASLERIRQDAGVKLGGELFSDAMGTPGQRHDGYDLGTYQGMIRQNVDRIVEGLK